MTLIIKLYDQVLSIKFIAPAHIIIISFKMLEFVNFPEWKWNIRKKLIHHERRMNKKKQLTK